MTNKERLEGIKEFSNMIKRLYWSENQATLKLAEGYFFAQHGDWLIQQAERVQELEKEIEDWRKEVKKWQRFFREEAQQNERYREAINNIIEKIMSFGTNEEVYEAIQDALKTSENKIER